MQIVCKCGFNHKDNNQIRTVREPVRSQRRVFCNICGRQLHIPTLRGTEYKKQLQKNK